MLHHQHVTRFRLAFLGHFDFLFLTNHSSFLSSSCCKESYPNQPNCRVCLVFLPAIVSWFAKTVFCITSVLAHFNGQFQFLTFFSAAHKSFKPAEPKHPTVVGWFGADLRIFNRQPGEFLSSPKFVRFLCCCCFFCHHCTLFILCYFPLFLRFESCKRCYCR